MVFFSQERAIDGHLPGVGTETNGEYDFYLISDGFTGSQSNNQEELNKSLSHTVAGLNQMLPEVL